MERFPVLVPTTRSTSTSHISFFPCTRTILVSQSVLQSHQHTHTHTHYFLYDCCCCVVFAQYLCLFVAHPFTQQHFVIRSTPMNDHNSITIQMKLVRFTAQLVLFLLWQDFQYQPKIIYTPNLFYSHINRVNFPDGLRLHWINCFDFFVVVRFIYRISSRTSLHIPTRASIFWTNMAFSYGNDVTLKWNMPPN